jgi:hypothetical protein
LVAGGGDELKYNYRSLLYNNWGVGTSNMRGGGAKNEKIGKISWE